MYLVGRTGPSQYTGGYGSQGDYHIDTKFSHLMPEAQRVQKFTELAQKAALEGRRFEFSNQGVAGRFFDPNASLEDRTALYRQAVGAHAPRSGFDSLDYYTVAGKDNRFGKSAEGAPIYMPGVEGGKITASSGGGYGKFAYVTGPKGNVLIKTGHADTRYPSGEIPALKPAPVAGVTDPGPTVATAKPKPDPQGSAPSQAPSEAPTVTQPAPINDSEPKAVEQPTPVDGVIKDRDFFKNEMRRAMLTQALQEDAPRSDGSAAQAEIAADMNKRNQRMARTPAVDMTPVRLELGDVFAGSKSKFNSGLSEALKSAQALPKVNV